MIVIVNDIVFVVILVYTINSKLMIFEYFGTYFIESGVTLRKFIYQRNYNNYVTLNVNAMQVKLNLVLRLE